MTRNSSKVRAPINRRIAIAATVGIIIAASACSNSSDPKARPGDTTSKSAASPGSQLDRCATPPKNTFMADSTAPIGHIDAAQSNATATAGPRSSKRTLTAKELQYTHLGPGHFGLAISSKYPSGTRVIWSNGGDRIAKLDEKSLTVLAELPLPGKELQSSDAADAAIAQLDSQTGGELANTAIAFAAKYLQGLAGVYYALDRDNTLFVGGADSVIAYQDKVKDDPLSPIVIRNVWNRPGNVRGGFTGVNITFDGKLVLVTDQGWVVVLERDFSDYVASPMLGAEAAAAHNADIVKSGRQLGSGSWVRNSLAVDDRGGIYVASLDHMHKLVWDGKKLSTSQADGAWSVPYLNSDGLGTGATPALMGYCDDRLVVITDGETRMNVVAFWRDAIPRGWRQLAGAPDPRIAGQVGVTMGDPTLQSIQTEQGVTVGGYGALVVNNAPKTIPDGFPAIGVRILVAYSGSDPAYAPHGLEKFEWDPRTRTMRKDWVNRGVSSANSVPIISLGSNTVYTVGSRDSQWALEGVDWSTGKSTLTWITGSGRYNTNFAGLFLDEDGRVIHGTAFGMLRYPTR